VYKDGKHQKMVKDLLWFGSQILHTKDLVSHNPYNILKYDDIRQRFDVKAKWQKTKNVAEVFGA
jgi:hypothetical protein